MFLCSSAVQPNAFESQLLFFFHAPFLYISRRTMDPLVSVAEISGLHPVHPLLAHRVYIILSGKTRAMSGNV